jgi:hypothetical protein
MRRGDDRWLRWESTNAAVEIVVTSVGDRMRLRLRLQPSFAAMIDVRRQCEVQKIQTDVDGAVQFDAPRGLASFVIASANRPEEPCLQTAWVTL